MKKLLLLVLMLSTALGAFVWYQGQNIDSTDVIQINIYKDSTSTPEHTYYPENKDEIVQIIDILNNLSISDEPRLEADSDLDYYLLDVITDRGEILSYDLSVNLDALILDIRTHEDEKVYTALDEQVKSLLSMNGFYDLYETSAPSLQLAYSTMTIPAKISESEWTFSLANGTEKSKKKQTAVDQIDSTIPLKQGHSIEVFSEKPSDLLTLKAYKGTQLIHEETIENGSFMPLIRNGLIRYEVASHWSKEGSNDPYGQSILTFYGDMNLVPELKMDKTTATAGDFIVIEIFNIDETQTPRIEQSLSKNFRLWKSDDRYFGFLAMNYWAKVGDYTLTLVVEDTTGATYTKEYPVKIADKVFNKQYLTIDKNVESSTKNDEAYAEYAKFFTPTRDESVAEKLWDGLFIQPVEGRISTEFAEMRYVNGSLTSYRHSGIDIAAPRGTNIVAPNGGLVKLSKSLILTGNTIVIDHGYGIFSIYFHMDSLNVNSGVKVQKGDIIGTVGSTGFSTGPHLHWTMSHYKTNVSPWLFMERNLLPEN